VIKIWGLEGAVSSRDGIVWSADGISDILH
jgi:hypothetical protein